MRTRNGLRAAGVVRDRREDRADHARMVFYPLLQRLKIAIAKVLVVLRVRSVLHLRVRVVDQVKGDLELSTVRSDDTAVLDVEDVTRRGVEEVV